MTDVVLAESGFCGVVIDDELKVSQSFGDLSPFLKPERFNFNLKELLFEPLSIAFGAAVHKVLKENKRLKIDNIMLREPEASESKHVSLVISPFQDRKTKKTGMLVLFKQAGAGESAADAGEEFSMDTHVKQHITNLEEELTHVRQELLSSNEFLESSKESLQSFNEELLSANEEMQSANEELQSMNEELETINNEHQFTIQTLTELNDDMNNYFRSSINGQLFVDNDLNLKKYSPATVKLINLKERDIGRPLSHITTNIKVETLIENIKSVISSGETITREVESVQGRVYEVMTTPYIRQSDNAADGAIVTFYDITDLKTIQQKLDHANKMLIMAGEAAGIGTWSMDMKNREFIPSERFKEILGFRQDDSVTYEMTVAQIIPEHQPLFLKAVEATLTGGEKFDVEFSFLRFNDQGSRWFKAIGNLTHDSAGRPAYFTGILHDITDQKKDDIRKNDFIAMASHELKTPLTSVQAYLQMLTVKAKKAEDDFTASVLGKANKQVKKMGDLINSFLNVSRLEAGKIQLDKQNFNIDELIHDVMDDMKLIVTDHNLVSLPCPPITIFADRDKIGQVINNLLSNAVKYSPKGGTIEASCKKLDGQVQVSLKDEGVGIPLKDQEHLFDRYYRIENMQNRNVSGFGIGLYLSAEIIQRHNGKIWVESEPGKGSTFYFSLPAVQ